MESGLRWVGSLGLGMIMLVAGCGRQGDSAGRTLLNVSYDPTRELYQDINQAFKEHWLKEAGQEVQLRQSHGGSGKQARAVIDGLEADVVTLALAYDIDIIQAKTGLIGEGWAARLPNNSAPYTSTIVFLVRKGNPKQIKDWEDLIREGVQVVTPNPQTSGGARWNYLAAWGYMLKKELGDLKRLNDKAAAAQVEQAQKKAREFVRQLFAHVPVLDTGARGATNTFVQRGVGDALLAWENEAMLTVKEVGADRFEMVTPSISILAEPPVAMVEKIAARHGTTALAEAYLKFLYTAAGQEIAARHYYRPRSPEIAEKHQGQFANVELFTIDDVFGGWQKAQATHFDDGGIFDQIYRP